jgi:hypothetical protein
VLRADLDTYATAWVLAGMYQLFGLVERLGIEDALRPDALQTLVLPFLETDRPGPRQPPSS